MEKCQVVPPTAGGYPSPRMNARVFRRVSINSDTLNPSSLTWVSLYQRLSTGKTRHICILPSASMFEHQGMDVWVLGSVDISDMLGKLRSPFVCGNNIITGFRYTKKLRKISMNPRPMKFHPQFVDVPIVTDV